MGRESVRRAASGSFLCQHHLSTLVRSHCPGPVKIHLTIPHTSRAATLSRAAFSCWRREKPKRNRSHAALHAVVWFCYGSGLEREDEELFSICATSRSVWSPEWNSPQRKPEPSCPSTPHKTFKHFTSRSRIYFKWQKKKETHLANSASFYHMSRCTIFDIDDKWKGKCFFTFHKLTCLLFLLS